MSVPDGVDHLVFAVPELEAGVRAVEERLGVPLAPGGTHRGAGTHNALLGLGPRCYLEVIAPDPAQPEPSRPRMFGLRPGLTPRLVGWSVRREDLAAQRAAAAAAGFELGEVESMSRERPDGSRLSWAFTDPRVVHEGGLIPFFINWGESDHPAGALATEAELVGLEAEHPDPTRLEAALNALGTPLRIAPGTRPALVATLATGRGRVRLS
ncbi:MAG: VOC family protein [Planctomycetota bacterium]